MGAALQPPAGRLLPSAPQRGRHVSAQTHQAPTAPFTAVVRGKQNLIKHHHSKLQSARRPEFQFRRAGLGGSGVRSQTLDLQRLCTEGNAVMETELTSHLSSRVS